MSSMQLTGYIEFGVMVNLEDRSYYQDDLNRVYQEMEEYLFVVLLSLSHHITTFLSTHSTCINALLAFFHPRELFNSIAHASHISAHMLHIFFACQIKGGSFISNTTVFKQILWYRNSQVRYRCDANIFEPCDHL